MRDNAEPQPENTGLTRAQVEASRRLHGGNELVQEKRTSFFSQFLQSFGDPIIKILLAALAINVVLFFRNFDWYETIGICISIFLATFVSTLSEYGSESAFRELERESAQRKSRVQRADGVAAVPCGEIVVGDLVLLQSGERVPADGVLIAGELRVDQSSLNGESVEAKKKPTCDPHPAMLDPGDPHCLYSGTVVCSGEGVMRVVQVGAATLYGGLAHELQGETRESPLKLRLAKLAHILSRIGYCAAALVAIADLTNAFVLSNNMNWPVILAQLGDTRLVAARLLHAMTLAITTVVVAVPEGLPMMITIVLSSNMKRMLRDHVLVRKLVGIETSGSLNLLFTDKTGTLTCGRLRVNTFVMGDGSAFTDASELKRKKGLWELLELSCARNNESLAAKGKIIGGNPTDRALLAFVTPVSRAAAATPVWRHLPFDSKQKFSAATLRDAHGPTLIKGAPERLLPACTRYCGAAGEPMALNTAVVEAAIRRMTAESMRVLALAVSEKPVAAGGAFSDLMLVGLVGIRDDVRPDARAAVQRVRDAGIQVVMVTGDNRETALAIGRSCGLVEGSGQGSVLTSAELGALSDTELRARLPALRVVARALPGDKSRLVRTAQNLGLVVGMTGDGVNDAPALKQADVGFAMGSGTEVAREAGDIVILNDSFSSIAQAVLYGRTIFKSIRKFIIFQLTMNLCAVGVSVIGPFIGVDTPITVVQMLWINIIMDTLAGLAFAGEPPLAEYMKERPKRRGEAIINRYMASQIGITGLYTLGMCVAFLKLPICQTMFRLGASETYFMTAFFTLFIYAGIFNSFSAHTNRLNLIQNLKRNPPFVVIMVLVSLVQLLMIYCGGAVFRTVGLLPRDLALVLLFAATVIPADLLRKLVLKRKGKNTGV